MAQIEEMSLEDAAAELASTKTSRLDSRGFATDDGPNEAPKIKKYSALVDDGDADDDATEETPSSVDEDLDEDEIEVEADEDSDSEEQDEPVTSTIDPPKSFTHAEQEEFRKLPPKVQETVSRRESERDRAVMQRMNAIAEEKQQLSPLANRLAQEQQNFVKLSELVAQMGIPEVQDFEGVDWVTLARNDPAAYTEKRARYDQFQQKLQLIGSQVQQVKAQQQQLYQQQYQQTVNAQLEQLLDAVPEFRDKAKATAIVNDITASLQEYGFSADELNQVVDNRVVRILADFSKMKVAEKNRQSALKKKTATQAPRVMQSNGNSNNRTESKNVKSKQAWDKLNKSGDIWDAVRVMNLRGNNLN